MGEEIKKHMSTRHFVDQQKVLSMRHLVDGQKDLSTSNHMDEKKDKEDIVERTTGICKEKTGKVSDVDFTRGACMKTSTSLIKVTGRSKPIIYI